MNGIINIYKEKGYTSHDVVAIARKILHQKKIGHTGTLDPEAEGVLPICIGKATKAVEYLTDQKKRYSAIVQLGISTTTQDHTGMVIEQHPVVFNEERIKEVIQSFIGTYDQIPPMYSALKVNGKRLYELARQGTTIERKPRRVYIYDINIISFIPPSKIEIDVLCSKGTYIRTLCADIGTKLGFGAHMKSLIRTEVGSFHIQNSIKLDKLRELANKQNLNTVITKVDEVFVKYFSVTIKPEGEKILKNGNKINFSYIQGSIEDLKHDQALKVYDCMGNFIGLYRVVMEEKECYLKPLKLFL